MPELPEVETTRRGLLPLVKGHRIQTVMAHETRMRWPFEPRWIPSLQGQTILDIRRRAKYLLMPLTQGELLIHLGMSGSLRCVQPDSPRRKHDHLEFRLDNGLVMRFHDPRRFGCVLWQAPGEDPPALLDRLGPEPLSEAFCGQHLFQLSRGRKQAVKAFIMDQTTVVGVGNIYASESLFLAGIHPARAAGRISRKRYDLLAEHIRQTLRRAIESGGSTLRDFLGGNGEPGYFQQTLLVYGREGQTCTRCGNTLVRRTIGQRASVYCAACQH